MTESDIKLDRNEIILRGVPSSPGIVLGKTVIIEQQTVFITADKVAPKDIPNEVQRFKDSINKLKDDYKSVIKKAKNETKNIKSLLESNLQIISDKIFFDSVSKRIKSGISTEHAVIEEIETHKNYFLNSPDTFLKDRAHELDHIKHKLISTLRNQKEIISAQKGSIVIAQFITPDELMKLKEMGVAAVVTEMGGITSHTAILARNFDLTHVIGVKDVCSLIKSNDKVIVDGYSGTVLINPSDIALRVYEEKKKEEESYKKKLGELKHLPAVTKDNFEIKLKANINVAEDIDIMQMVGAEGVGLVRTEYLVISKGKFPDCTEQYEWYKKIADQSYPNPVNFRVFDLGSDKAAEGLPRHEDNPALGFRGIRFLLERKDIFAEQICAILRASQNKNAQLLLPMITTVAELLEAKKIIEDCKLELKEKSIPFDPNMPVGVMVETPAAALISCLIAEHCEFISIGTNDLTQYTLAADRTNEMVTHHYDVFHPAVLKLIKMTINSAKQFNIPVSVCGEFAAHPSATELLVGMGVDELSIAPSVLLETKKRIRKTNYQKAKEKSDEILLCNCIEEIKQKISI